MKRATQLFLAFCLLFGAAGCSEEDFIADLLSDTQLVAALMRELAGDLAARKWTGSAGHPIIDAALDALVQHVAIPGEDEEATLGQGNA